MICRLRRLRVGVEGCLPLENFGTPHFTHLKILNSSIDYPPQSFKTPHFIPPPKKKKSLDVPV